MRAASFLKQPLPSTIMSAELSLKATRTSDELQSVWWRDAERFEGEARERLQEVYAEQLRKFGALQG